MTKEGDKNGTVLEAVRAYMALGWYPLRLRPNEKACADSDWTTRVYSDSDFHEGDNVGLRLVPATDKRAVKLCAVDLDCDEAAAMYEKFFQPTAPAWGRKSKPVSQALYDAALEKTVAFKDGDVTLLELRTNHQSMSPPSVHPNGEHLVWIRGPFAAPKVEAAALLRRCRLLATACLLSRHWPGQGARHEWTMAMAGSLRQVGMTEEESSHVVDRAAERAGDGKRNDRATEVKSTYSRPTEGLAGFGKLAEIVGEGLGDSLRKIWAWAPAKTRKGRSGGNDQEAVRGGIERLGVKLSYDLFSNRALVERDGWDGQRSLDDAVAESLLLEYDRSFGVMPSLEFFVMVLRDMTRASSFHPVRDWLASLKWDGKPRLDRWLIDYAGADDTDLNKQIGRLTLLAAVRRVRRPGAKFDQMLVLEGEQGVGKSTGIQALCPREEWFSHDLPLNAEPKEIIEATAGKWLVEAAELGGMRRGDVEQLKSMLSRQVDGPVRLAYARLPIEVPRQFIPIGSTNSNAYLLDHTGARRFWCVKVKRLAVDVIRRDRDQIWAEAAMGEAQANGLVLDERHWPDAAKEQEKRRLNDPWEDCLAAKYGWRGDAKVSNADLYDCVGVPPERRDRVTGIRMTEVMQKLGFTRTTLRIKGAGAVVRGWIREGPQMALGRAKAKTELDAALDDAANERDAREGSNESES